MRRHQTLSKVAFFPSGLLQLGSWHRLQPTRAAFVGGPVLLLLACSAAHPERPANDGRPSTVGVSLALPCKNAKAYEPSALLPIGQSADDLISRLGKERSAPEIGLRVAVDGRGVSPKAPTRLSMSFERAPGAVTYQDDCGPPFVSAKVMLHVELSSGAKWQSGARLNVKAGLDGTLRTEPEGSAPFQIVARLTPEHTDVELTPSGAARPTRFSTLCPIQVAPAIASSFGVAPAAALAPAETAALTCTRPDGSQALLETPMTSKLVAYQEQACAPVPGAPAQFELVLQVEAAWANEPLRGQGTLDGEGDERALRYRVQGKARGDKRLAMLLPCAATDENVSVAIEGGFGGSAQAGSKPTKVTFTFSCADVQVECTSKH